MSERSTNREMLVRIGVVCDIFPMHSASFFAKSIKIIPRHVCLAIGYGLNEALS